MTEDELNKLIPPLDVYSRALCRRATPEEIAQVRRYLLAEAQFLAEETGKLVVQDAQIQAVELFIPASMEQNKSFDIPVNYMTEMGNYGSELGRLGATAGVVLAASAITGIVAAPIILPFVAGAAAFGWLGGKLIGSKIKK